VAVVYKIVLRRALQVPARQVQHYETHLLPLVDLAVTPQALAVTTERGAAVRGQFMVTAVTEAQQEQIQIHYRELVGVALGVTAAFQRIVHRILVLVEGVCMTEVHLVT
jgi:hypothetical protein